MIVTILIVLLVILLIVGTPVAFALGMAGVLGLLLTGDNLAAVPQIIYETFNTYDLIAVPLFVLMGQVLLQGKVGEHLFAVINQWVRHWPGGLGVATVLSCGFFAAVAGSSTATAATVGSTAIPAMTNRGYSRSLACGLVAGGGTLGILIPPSIPFVLYGAITSESIGKLFLAGLMPGLFMLGTFVLYVLVLAKMDKRLPRGERVPLRDRLAFSARHIGALLIPVVVLGGIYAGACTPTEAAAVGALYSFLLCLVVYRSLSLRDIPKVLTSTAIVSCMILMIIAVALVLSRVITTLQVAPQMVALFEEYELGKWFFLIAMNILWFIMGCFLDVASIMLITLPVAFPVALSLGIDPIWFAVIMVVNMEIATITPPIGLNLFVVMGASGERDIRTVIKGVIPIFFLLLANLIVVMAWPQLSLWLPSRH